MCVGRFVKTLIEINSSGAEFGILQSISSYRSGETVAKILNMNHHDRLVLQNTNLLAGLNPQLVSRILGNTTIFSAESRDGLFNEGEKADSFYVVLSGYVRLFRKSKDEREADIGIFGPGEAFGECMMFSEYNHAFSAQSAGPATFARFPLDKMRMIVQDEPEFAIAIFRIMARHLIDARENVAEDRLHTAPQRVANYLLKLALAHGVGQPVAFRLPFQKSLLAGKLGLAPEALSRALSALKKAGIRMRGRMIEVTDIDALKNV